MAIERVKIRARVRIGGLTAETPVGSSSNNIILSFNVNKNRGQPSTFSARLKIRGSGLDTSGAVKIYAGSDSASTLIFTGFVKKATISPCFDDPSYVIVSVSGTDVLSLLQGKKFTRRCIGTKTSWVTINGVSRKGLKSEKFKYKNEPVVILTDSELGEAANVTFATNVTNKNPYDGGVTLPISQDGGASLEVSFEQDAGGS